MDNTWKTLGVWSVFRVRGPTLKYSCLGQGTIQHPGRNENAYVNSKMLPLAFFFCTTIGPTGESTSRQFSPRKILNQTLFSVWVYHISRNTRNSISSCFLGILRSGKSNHPLILHLLIISFFSSLEIQHWPTQGHQQNTPSSQVNHDIQTLTTAVQTWKQLYFQCLDYWDKPVKSIKEKQPWQRHAGIG